MKSRDQSSVGPTPVLRSCQFDRSVSGIEGDGLLKPASEDLLRPSCRASAGRDARGGIVKRDTPKADGDPGTQVVVRAPELHRPLLVKAHPRGIAVIGGSAVRRGGVVLGIVGRGGS